MKKSILLGAVAALLALGSSAKAQTIVDITGATAFRAAAIDTILASYGTNLSDFASNGATGIAGLRGASQAIFSGQFSTIPGTTIIRCTWTGSVEGIRDLSLQQNQNYMPVSTLTAPTSNTTTISGVTGTFGNAAGTEQAIPDLAFSDVYPSTTPYDASKIIDSTPGVVVFTMITNEGAPAEFNNVTAGQFRALFSSGFLPLGYFVPSLAGDPRAVYATGRSDFSGTRTTYLAETGYGVAQRVQQWKATVTGSGATQAIDTLRLWPVGDGVSASTVWGGDALGNGGYQGGGDIRPVFSSTSASVQLLNTSGAPSGARKPLFVLTALGISDAQTAIAAGGKALSYNGVGITPANPLSAPDIAKVTEGAYTLWGYEHFVYNEDNFPTEVETVYTELGANIGANLGTSGIDFTLMNVSRNNDGSTVAP